MNGNATSFASLPLIILLCLITAVAPPAVTSAQTVLRIGKNAMPPLSMEGDTGGLDRMLAEAFQRIHRRVDFVILPSERSLSEANTGIIDGDHGRVAGLEKLYPNLIRVPEPNMEWEFVAFTTKPDITLNGWESLHPYRVGIVIGWKILEENVNAGSVTKVATLQQLFALLKHGRVDIVICERNGGNYQIQAQDIPDAHALEPPLARQNMYLYLNKKHLDIVPALAQAIRDMKADGTYGTFLPQPNPR